MDERRNQGILPLSGSEVGLLLAATVLGVGAIAAAFLLRDDGTSVQTIAAPGVPTTEAPATTSTTEAPSTTLALEDQAATETTTAPATTAPKATTPPPTSPPTTSPPTTAAPTTTTTEPPPTVPNVIGEREDVATELLQAKGLTVSSSLSCESHGCIFAGGPCFPYYDEIEVVGTQSLPPGTVITDGMSIALSIDYYCPPHDDENTGADVGA